MRWSVRATRHPIVIVTLTELQQRSEQVLGRALDKSSFRRRVADRNCVEAVEGEFRLGANRPAQLFRLSATQGR